MSGMNANLTSPLLIPESEWPALRQRAHSPFFAAAMGRLRQDVAEFMEQGLAVPDEPGGHYHHYFCPEHGSELEFDPRSPGAHRCPVDGALFHGAPYDAAWRWFVNNRLSQGALRLAVLWQLEGDPHLAARVTDILTGYAERYAGYRAVPRPHPNTGIATHQTLDEAVWILPLAWAFDLVAGTMSAGQVETIGEQLLIPVAEFLIRRHYAGIHNFACWHNAAIATVGLVTQQRNLVEFAVDGEFGLETQLREGVLADGLWFEGSFSYHFYTLAALLMQLKATIAMPEFDLRDRPAVRAMFEAPLLCAYPDGSLPATNDCWYFTSLIHGCCHGVPPAPAFYEIGYAWYREAHFAQVLQRAYQHGPRDSLDALLHGVELIPSAEPEPQKSVHLPGSGYAILRTADTEGAEQARVDDQSYIFLKYGPHGGGHGHPDKLNLILYAHDRRLSADLGTPGYGLDLFQSWYRRTVSHNTMTIDGRSQPPATGRIVRFDTGGVYQVADASVAWPEGDYAGVEMRRVLLARPDYFLDICTVTCGRARRIDWIYHNMGELRTGFDLSPAVGMADEGEGYEHLAGLRRGKTDEDLSLSWLVEGGGLALFMAGAAGSELLTATAPGYPPTAERAVVINRRHAAQTTYLSLFHPHGQAPSVHSVHWHGRQLLETGWAGCTVQTRRGLEAWLIRLSGDLQTPPWGRRGEADTFFEYSLA